MMKIIVHEEMSINYRILDKGLSVKTFDVTISNKISTVKDDCDLT